MKGSAGIPQLQLVTLNKLITAFQRNPSLYFSTMFGTTKADSDTIKWEVEYGSAGMTPFVAPGSVAPTIGLDGVGEGSAKCAFFKEKIYYDEEFLNNLRQLGTYATFETAQRKLARGLKKLRNRIDRRREWMISQAIINGTFSYVTKGDVKASVSYGVPTSHQITIPGGHEWDDGASRNPIGDIFDAKITLSVDSGVEATNAMCNSVLLKVLMNDSKFLALLARSAFGNGDLFANPAKVIGTLLGVGELKVYDELYESQAFLLTSITGSSTTTATVDDATDLDIGGTARLINTSKAYSWEDVTLTDVNKTTNVVTFAAPAASFVGGRDKISFRHKFIGDDTFLMFSKTANEGDSVCEIMESPYGLGRTWGVNIDTKDEWDPEGTWLRIQDKCLPVIYHPDCSIKLKVY